MQTNVITHQLAHLCISLYEYIACHYDSYSLLGVLRAAVKAVCAEYRCHNADVHMREDCDVDDLVDVIEGSRVYIPAIYAVNKIDQITLVRPHPTRHHHLHNDVTTPLYGPSGIYTHALYAI